MDEVAQLFSVLVDLGCLAGGHRAREDRRDSGVWRVPGHPWSVHVVIAERGHGDPGFTREGETEVLLVELRRGVDVARVRPCDLGDRLRVQRLSASGADRVETSGVQVVLGSRLRRSDCPMRRARVTAFSVDDHAAGEDKPAAEPRRAQLLEQNRRPEVILANVVRDVGVVRPSPTFAAW